MVAQLRALLLLTNPPFATIRTSCHHCPSLLLPPSHIAITPSISTTTRRTPTTSLNARAHPQIHVYPEPIPEFAASETRKFEAELRKKLSVERETFGDDLDAVVQVCSEIFREFLYEEYGGPGTLSVEPFTDMLVALKENNLPGASLAARTSLLWAQNFVDRDWELWNSKVLS